MSLTSKTLAGFSWTFAEKLGAQGIGFIVSIFLARLLAPADFGLIAMTTIVVSLSQAIIDGGFSQALIQKKDADSIDYSSVFFLNLVVSLALYAALFVSAPLIAIFYNQPPLSNIVRAIGLVFVLNAFTLVQNTRLTKQLNFKIQMKMRLPSLVFGGIVGVLLAYSGFGVWSLVLQQLASVFLYTCQMWIRMPWKPHWILDLNRIKILFSFGNKLLASSIIDTLFQNAYVLAIGRFFTPTDVGFFERAHATKNYPVSTISNALQKVTFPVLASIQDDTNRLKEAYRKIILQIFFWITPLLTGAALLAEPLFSFLFTDKWLPAVPYFRWLCVVGVMYPLSVTNLNVLKVKRRSDLYLRLEIIKKLIVAIGIAVSIPFGVMALIYFQVIQSFVGYSINSYYSGKLIRYSGLQQIKDVMPVVILSLCMAAFLWLELLLLPITKNWILLLIATGSGALFYLAAAFALKMQPLMDLSSMFFKNKRVQ